jgi:hypothetical protein
MPRRILAALAAPLFAAHTLHADIVILYNGKWYEGVIKEETQDKVVIDALVSGIRTELTLERRNVTSIERKPLPDGFFGGKKSEPVAEVPAGIRYVVIPIIGEFGKDVFPGALAGVLAECREQKVEHVVLRIKSPGGAVWVAQEIAGLLQNEVGEMKIHAVVEDALSAAVWPVFASHTVWVLPGASIGAAVVFKQDHTTGAAQVDAKMNSAIAAGLAGIAEKRGHLGLLARAMILPEARVYRYIGEDAKAVVAADPPSGRNKEIKQFDDERSILTLTASDAVEVGLAKPIDAFDLDALRNALGVGEWSPAKVAAETTIKRYTEASRTLTEQIEQVATELAERIAAAAESDPYRFNYKVYPDGAFTPDSQRRWSELSGKCTEEWMKVRSLLQRFQGLQKKAADLKITPLAELIAKDKIRTSMQEVDAKLATLKRDRSRTRPPAEFERK